MRITELKLSEIAGFRDATFEFRAGRDDSKADVHLLVGPNGSGKTTAIMALAQFFALDETGILLRMRGASSYALLKTQESAGSPTIVSGIAPGTGPGWPPDLALRAEFGGSDATMHGYPAASRKLDQYRAYASGAFYVPVSPFKGFSFAAFAYSGARSVRSYEVTSVTDLQSPPLADACVFNNPDKGHELLSWVANNKAREALAAVKGDTERAREKRVAVERVETTIRDITGLDFGFEFTDEPFHVSARVGGDLVQFDVLPDGLRSILGWVGDLLMRMDRVPWVGNLPLVERTFFLFLDEIDIHLHPAWQRAVLPAVQGLFPKAQVFVTTHSPFVIASADDAWIYPIQMTERGSVVGEPLPSQLGQSYPSILKEVMGVESRFGPQVERHLAEFYQARDRVLRGEAAIEELNGSAAALGGYNSAELDSIVGMEMQALRYRLKGSDSSAADAP